MLAFCCIVEGHVIIDVEDNYGMSVASFVTKATLSNTVDIAIIADAMNREFSMLGISRIESSSRWPQDLGRQLFGYNVSFDTTDDRLRNLY